MGTTSTLSIGDALFGRTRQRVLALLFGQPDRRFFTNEIVRQVGAGTGAVQRELERLVSSGLAELTIEGRQRYVQAARESPVFEEIEALVRKTFGIADVLRAALAPLAERIAFAGVYGSMARGAGHSQSDIDLLVLGDVEYLELAERLVEPERSLGRPINPTLFTLREWRKRLREGSGFAHDVSSRPLMPVIGDLHEPGKPGEDRKPARAGIEPGRNAAIARGGATQRGRRKPSRTGA